LKPAPFAYEAPASLGEAIELLASDPDAVVISGGQSLMPVLAFRLATPSLLVDLRRLPGLADITIDDTGIRLGARVRWRDIEDDARLAIAHPLLRAAIRHVAHYGIRNRGTVGGSLAHADPAAELPGIAVTCDGEITLVGPAGTRKVRTDEFFTGALSTTREPAEIVTELHLPFWPKERRWAFHRDGKMQNAHVGVIAACDRPHRLSETEAVLNGHVIDESVIREAAAAAARGVDPPEDVHASAAYRRALVATLVERGLRAAVERRDA
jgi:carbon-monoxide dehydrogenase medium subunit